jgi:soluble lytic murein transglycosylase-like protein
MTREVGIVWRHWPMILSCILAAATPAAAQVLDVARDGEVMTISGPAVFTSDGVEPILLPAATTTFSSPSSGTREQVMSEIAQAAAIFSLDPRLIEAVAWRESAFVPGAISPKGAVGVMQLTAQAAHEVGVDRFDLRQNIRGGTAYLRRQIDDFRGDLALGLAAYNAGPGAVRRYGGVPPYPETQAYVSAVIARLGRAVIDTPVGAETP